MTTDELQTHIEEIATKGGAKRCAVALHDFQRGTRFDFHGDEIFHAASTMKVAVLLALYKAVDEGRVSSRDPLHVRNRFRSAANSQNFRLSSASDGYADLYKLVGRTARVGQLAEWMIIWSSNLATNLLIEWLGVGYVEEVLRAARVEGVHVRRGVDDEAAYEAGMNNETTARGLADLFATLRSEFLTKQSRDEVIRILLNQQFTSMLPAGLPKHATAAHKTGEISSVCHDAGIVYLPEREPYIVAILTENSSDGRRDVVAKISDAVYKFVAAAT